MYEIRKAGRMYRIYDRVNKQYVAHTNSKQTADELVTDTLHHCGFQGSIPNFFLRDLTYGVKIQKKC